MPSHLGQSSSTIDLTQRIHAILARKGLTLYQVSQHSAALYGRSSQYFLPHNLYYNLRQEPFTPSLFQVFALSRISGYRIADWLRTFEIDLENIPRLQALLERKRTALIDSSWTDSQAWITWFRSRDGHSSIPPIAALAQLLEPIGPRRIGSLQGGPTSKFLYAKIGNEDALAFPELIPGSIVRADPEIIAESVPAKDGQVSERIFLLEHSKGLFCCRVRRVRENVVVPIGTEFSYAQVELRVPSETRLLGVVDFEIRSLVRPVRPDVPSGLAKLWKPRPLIDGRTFRQFLTTARTNAGLSLREAAANGRNVSSVLQDHRYRLSASSLCDYEVYGVPPRDPRKIVTLCSVFGLMFESFLRSIGIPAEQAGTEALPDHLVGRFSSEASEISIVHTGFLEHLLQISEEVPFFLRSAIGPFVGLREQSLEDFFWVGGDREPLHPYFASGLLAIVNRRRKTPFRFPSKPLWKQPVYLLLQRDGTYLCACCDVENGTLVINPYTKHVPRALQFRHRKDIEVVGQIMAIARSMA